MKHEQKLKEWSNESLIFEEEPIDSTKPWSQGKFWGIKKPGWPEWIEMNNQGREQYKILSQT